jgi:hypothetical protein
MRTRLFIAPSILLLSQLCFGQAVQLPASSQPEQSQQDSPKQVIDLPQPKRSFKPKLTLQRALQIAEKYAQKQKIDLSSYYLYEAKWILYGTDAKEPRWYFWWIHESGAAGRYVEITVSMDGKLQLIPSM